MTSSLYSLLSEQEELEHMKTNLPESIRDVIFEDVKQVGSNCCFGHSIMKRLRCYLKTQ